MVRNTATQGSDHGNQGEEDQGRLGDCAVAAAGGAALKVAGKLGEKVTAKVKDVLEGEKGSEQSTRPA